jgi:hypothetical protein
MNKHMARRKQSGQALIIMAGALVALIALVALAVDGGNAYAQRRIAQNAADGASLAGASKMKDYYLANMYTETVNNTKTTHVYPLSTTQNQGVLGAIRASLEASGVCSTGDCFAAKYLDQNGQVYAGSPQVGGTQSVPFYGGYAPGSAGVQGLTVNTSATAGTYFARLIGQPTVSAAAASDASIKGVEGIVHASDPTQSGGDTAPRLWPLVIFANTVNVNGGLTSLYDFDTGYSPGNWGELCFHSTNCGQSAVNDQYANGFDPATGTQIAEDTGAATSEGATSPGTEHNIPWLPLGWDSVNHNTRGVWINAKTGNSASSACHSTFATAAANHWTVLIPIADYDNARNGSNAEYHVINVAAFKIQSITCPGSHNSITGNFVGWGWGTGDVKWSNDLNNARQNGQIGITLGH